MFQLRGVMRCPNYSGNLAAKLGDFHGTVVSLISIMVLSSLGVGCNGGTAHDPMSFVPPDAKEVWPPYNPDPAWKAIAANAVKQYTAAGYSYKYNLQNYTTAGDYLNFGTTFGWQPSNDIHFDSNGVPLVNYSGTFYYNPATVAIFALFKYGRYVDGIDSDLTTFWAAVDRLMLLQALNGSLPYTFDYPYFRNSNYFHAPWTSGLAQGVVLSVFARAYLLTPDQKYLDAGDRAFYFLSVAVSSGGDTEGLQYLDPSLSGEIFADEYPAVPSAYTLNGFIFPLLGVYDWSQTPAAAASTSARKYFDDSMHTLTKILPYYDIGGFSAYDLGHIIYRAPPAASPAYHVIHIYLLHAIESITHDAVVAHYESLWRSYVTQ
jgi:heparosan-N-sulfate-glucuronate 5-epimerase